VKRFLVILLASAYFAASCGFSLRQHYCMGMLVGTSIDHSVDQNDRHFCTKCGMEKKQNGQGCCEDRVKSYKCSPDQLLSKIVLVSGHAIAILVPSGLLEGTNQVPIATNVSGLERAHDPPDLHSLPRYLMNRSLRI